MITVCEVCVPVEDIREDIRKELLVILNSFGPEEPGVVEAGVVLEFPSFFKRDPSEAIDDFFAKYDIDNETLFHCPCRGMML